MSQKTDLPVRNVSRLKAMWLLVFRPEALKRLADEKAADQRSRELGSAVQVEPIPNLHTAVDTIRQALSNAALLVLVSIVLGLVLSALGHALLGPVPAWLNGLLQYLAIGVLLWATLAKQGWNIQTMKGQSLPELVNEWIYRSLYVAGSVMLVIGISWPSHG